MQLLNHVLSRKKITPFSLDKEQKEGKGFSYKGKDFIHHSGLHHTATAFYRFSVPQMVGIFLMFLVLTISFAVNWHVTVEVIIALFTGLYFLDLLFNLYLIYRSFAKSSEITILPNELASVPENSWPSYTILCPLYNEWEVVPQFISAMRSLEYPKEKLQVLLLLEANDRATIEKIRNFSIPPYFEIVVVPQSFPKTKPKACNYGLLRASGDYCVIFDAEDMPEPLQLKKAVLAFDKADENTACIQAKLNFYNPSQNLLTKLFTAEYSLWFELVLTGLQSINAPIPLGGTSNHFRTQDLRKLHGWDSFNVTEDADLGIRIAKAGYTTAIVDSETLEEANSNLTNWFWQRSRWIKGYIQTYFLHMRRPGEFLQKGRTWNLFTFQLVIGGKVLSMLINPVMWTITICYFVLRAKYGLFIQSFFPSPILYMGVVSWIFGNFLYLYYYMLGCAKHKHYFLIPYVVFVPFYWLGMSMAMYMAVWKFMISPHQWSKTKHGLHLDSHATDDSVMEVHAPTTLFAKLITLSELLSLEKLCVYLSALLSSIAIFISYRHNWILAYGDAESHINIAKKVVSALTPGFAQLGGIWLPLPHLFMLPFMFFDPLWKTGLGGSIVSGIAFIIAGLFLYKTIFLVTKNRLGSFLGYLVFAVNFNVLYMQSTPMSELTLIAFLILSTYYFIRYLYVSDGLSYLLLSAFFSFCATLSRYDAWFLILFQAGIILLLALKHASTRQKRLGEFFTFSTLAFFGVLLWLAWGWLILGDPFYFTNSQYSAHAQQLGWFARNELPAYHQVLASFSYYAVTSVFTIGTIISTVALFSLYVFLFDEKIRYRGFILLILFVPFLFNAFSLYMGQAVIFIPILTPKTYEYTLFNVRYGMLMIAVAGFLYGYLVYKVPSFFKLLLFLGILFQTSLFLTHSFPVITLDDGTHGLSASKTPLNVEHFINTHYTKGLVLIDDYARTISIAKSTIPMNSIIYVGTKPYWNESIAHPEKYATWIIMQKDDAVWTGIYTDDARKAELYKYFNKVYTSNSILVFERMKPEAPVIGKE